MLRLKIERVYSQVVDGYSVHVAYGKYKIHCATTGLTVAAFSDEAHAWTLCARLRFAFRQGRTDRAREFIRS
jgi:hypothetical protein